MRYVVLVVGLCCVASAALFARYGLGAGVTAVSLSAWRLVIAAGALWLWSARLWRRFGWPTRSDALLLAVAGVFLALHFAMWIASLETLSVARSTLLVSTSPIWAGLTAVAIPRLRPRPLFWLGLAIAIVGAVVFVGRSESFRGVSTGDLLAIGGAACVVPYLFCSQDVQKRLGTLRTVTGIYTVAAGSLVLYLLATSALSVPRSGAAWIAILGMAVFAQLIGHSSLNWCLRHFAAAEVATATLLEPVFAAALAVAILGERVGWLQGFGGLVLLAGVALSLRSTPIPREG